MAVIIDFKTRKALVEPTELDKYVASLYDMDKLEILEEMFRFNDATKNGSQMTEQQKHVGKALFMRIVRTAESQEMKDFATQFLKVLAIEEKAPVA